eukprot:13801336-Ditylum_brightwellii.AAC.1
MKIQGLCPGGGGVSVGAEQYEILLLMRNDVSDADKKRYEIHRGEVLLPFISDTRKEFHGWQENMLMPEDLKVISWQDGDLAQIANLTSEETMKLYEELLIIPNKQNPVRSTEE